MDKSAWKERAHKAEDSLRHLQERDELFRKQRAERGWDDSETWSLDQPISAFVTPRLKRFKELNIGHPPDLTSESWNEILDKMIFSLEFLGSDQRWEYFEQDMEKMKEHYERVREGCELFGKYFQDLWW